ncbi:MAG: bifunctional (p)ppGpp synthetase/guanosine-3',5'-bis(diphosphate) 3'-pyrophosphohydrolase [Firmicutes bacterium]|nr:bifunctional (p)ppGpp synthetase/guanosine-3',5'-bis(diphosphate) 3'-pyrophosphohydrolase [Bacillota bacterium]
MQQTQRIKELMEKTPQEQIQALYDELIAKIRKYHPSDDLSMVERAYSLAFEAHREQYRKSGEPYIIHPLCVAIILADLELDMESITAGLLHDVVEDTHYTLEDISAMFGEDVALLVDGVTKLEKIKFTSKEEFQAENYRKMFLSMAKDIRVILIKVADRLHNMRTLRFMRPEKQKEIAQETLNIYAPLANRLGISKIKVELEDLCLRYLEPDAYYDLVDKIQRKHSEREQFVAAIVENIKAACDRHGIHCEVYGRPKHFFSIYKKMHNKNKTIDQIFDLFAVRVLVDTLADCYGVLGLVHEMYKPLPGRFKDYISMPKANRYQSLHNTLIGPEGTPFEIQIRTWEMHRIAEYGIAAHWRYKEGKTDGRENSEDDKLTWLRKMLEWQKEMSDNKEFLDTMKTDLDSFNDNVYCFSPRGDVISLREGSCPVDFAYTIHSAVGNTMVGARANGHIVTFDYKIQNGDIIEIITSQNSRGPSMDWLNFVKTPQAKTKINQWYKKINKEENILRGKELLEKDAKKKNLNINDLLTPDGMQNVMERYSFRTWDTVCAAIGHGSLKEAQVVNKLKEFYDEDIRRHKTAEELLAERDEKIHAQMEANAHAAEGGTGKSSSGIYVKGVGDIDVRFSKCCTPVPGDEIIGFVTRGRGVSIHRTDCINIINLSEDDRHRLIEAHWNVSGEERSYYTSDIRIIGHDRDRFLMDILKVVADDGIAVQSAGARAHKNGTVIAELTISIHSREQLDIICKKIYNIDGVENIERVTT